MEFQETIACCVGSSTASMDVLRAVEGAGARATTVSRRYLLRNSGREGRWAALIYEIRPRDHQANALVTAFRERQPGTPIMLYTPVVAGAGALLEKLVGLGGVFVHLRCESDGGVQTLHEDVIRMLSHAPGSRLDAMIRAALPTMPPRLADYSSHILTALGTENGPVQLTTANVANEMGIAVRTLERTCTIAGYPKPKEMLSWMVLLYLTLLARYNQMTPYKVGRCLRMSACTTNRLRQRLLSESQSEAWKKDRGNGQFKFELVFRAFVARCGEAAHAAVDALATDHETPDLTESRRELRLVEC